MLTHLRLKNFKSWKDTGDIALRPITAIFGANSTGKSALIQSLLMLKQTAEASDRNITFDFGRPNALVDLGDFPSVVHQHDMNAAVEISLDWKHHRTVWLAKSAADGMWSDSIGFRVRADLCADDNAAPSTDLLEYRLGETKVGMQRQSHSGKFSVFARGGEFRLEPRFTADEHIQEPLPRPVKCYGFPHEARLFYHNAAFLPNLELALEERLSDIYYLGPLRAQPQREYRWSGAQPADVGRLGESAVEAILGSRQNSGPPTPEEQVTELFREIGLLHKFGIEQIGDSSLYRVKVKQSEASPEALITDVGFGISQILPVLVLCFYAPIGSTIILEQPEIHLHPAVQSALGDVLIAARQRRDVQIIVESHSEHLLRRLQRRIAEETLPQDELGVYFCENVGAHSEIKELELDQYGNIKNWPTHFFGDDFGEIAETHKAILQRRSADAAG